MVWWVWCQLVVPYPQNPEATTTHASGFASAKLPWWSESRTPIGANVSDPYGYGSIPIHTIFSGMNIHKSQLFWGSLGTRVLTHCRIYDYSCWVYVLICDQLRSPNFKSAQMISRRVHDGCTSVEGKTCSPRPLINFPVICARLNEKRLLIIWIFWIL